MRVTVFVEGPSDAQGLKELFADSIRAKADLGVAIDFHPATEGDRKKALLLKAPVKAVNILSNRPDSMVGIVADLTPPNKGFTHTTPAEMISGIRQRFDDNLRRKNIDDARLQQRLGVFCFKYEFEVLLLAAEEQLRSYLGCSESECNWTRPPEDQNHGDPPKDVLVRLFKDRNRLFDPVLDAPAILRGASLVQLKQACPQCFARFAEWLESAA